MEWVKSISGAFLLCAGVACSAEPSATGDAEPEAVEAVQEPLFACPTGVVCQDFTSGAIRVRVYQCPWVGFQSHNITSCSVDAREFVRVGGGAEILGSPTPGALITASYPEGNGWVVQTKDHVQLNFHWVRAYAIGLRLSGYSAGQLDEVVETTSTTSAGGAVHAPFAQAFIPASSTKRLMLSGGARAFGEVSGAGQLLVESAGSLPNGPWIARAKDHMVTDLGYVTSFITYIPECPPGLSYCLEISADQGWGSSGTGYRGASIDGATDFDGNTGFITVGLGARQENSGQGRLLSDLHPKMVGLGGGTYAGSKDHLVADSGRVQAVAHLLRVRP
jgi:hypothetical protein